MCLSTVDIDLKLVSVNSIASELVKRHIPCEANVKADLVGDSYAYNYAQIYHEAERQGMPWHLLILQTVVISLLHERFNQFIIAGYRLRSDFIQLVFLHNSISSMIMTCPSARSLSGYFESSADRMPIRNFRPIAYWEPPSSMVALWPLGWGAFSDAALVIDTAAMSGYCNYPESLHDQSVPISAAGPDYVRVPQVEEVSFQLGSRSYSYVNKFYRLS